MLDIHIMWFLVLTVNFLALIYILNIVHFRPLLRIFKEREDIVRDNLTAAKEMNRKKEEGLEKMNRELVEARNRAKNAFEKLRTEGLEIHKGLLAGAESNAADMLRKARAELEGETEKARNTLRSDVDKFSDEIVRKLVKA